MNPKYLAKAFEQTAKAQAQERDSRISTKTDKLLELSMLPNQGIKLTPKEKTEKFIQMGAIPEKEDVKRLEVKKNNKYIYIGIAVVVVIGIVLFFYIRKSKKK
jgi:hypothetical protein